MVRGNVSVQMSQQGAALAGSNRHENPAAQATGYKSGGYCVAIVKLGSLLSQFFGAVGAWRCSLHSPCRYYVVVWFLVCGYLVVSPAWLGGFQLSRPCFLVGARTASGLRGVGLCGSCVARRLSAFAAMLSDWRPDGLRPSRRRPVRSLRGSEALSFRSHASWLAPGRPPSFAASV